MLFLELFGYLLLILVAAEIFVNALEHLGEKLEISEGVTGSLFAAVGTAMPETLVPLLAIFATTGNATTNEEIGVGAILGAPLMLSTLSLCLMSVAVLKRRGLQGHLTPEKTGLKRDLDFFLMAFLLAFVAMFVPHGEGWVRGALAFVMVMIYFVYVMMTLRASAKLVEEGHATEAGSPMLLTRLGLPQNLLFIVVQLALGLGLLVAGAKGFIHGVELAAPIIGISALLLSLMIIPIATELPEKVNSILWIRKHKDTLAFGNITGAMVFQGTLLPAIGISLTPWAPQKEVLLGVLVTLVAAFWLRWAAFERRPACVASVRQRRALRDVSDCSPRLIHSIRLGPSVAGHSRSQSAEGAQARPHPGSFVSNRSTPPRPNISGAAQASCSSNCVPNAPSCAIKPITCRARGSERNTRQQAGFADLGAHDQGQPALTRGFDQGQCTQQPSPISTRAHWRSSSCLARVRQAGRCG